MSGHSKWATIKRKKGAADAKRGQAFTKLANAIAAAARDGSDPDMNFRLRLAIDQAKTANMPAANIERSIARGSGQLKGQQIEEVTYEGYAPGGVAVIVKAATDNKNRTLPEVRTAFSKHGGNLAAAGAVAYQFEPKGVIQLEPADMEAASLAAIDAGAADVEADDGTLTIYTKPRELNRVKSQLEAAGYQPASVDLSFVPKQTAPVNDPEAARKILALMDALDALDDVTATYANFDIPVELLES